MSKKTHYKFNPDTLSFEIESVTFVSRLKNIALMFLTGCVVAVAWIFIYSLFFNTPKEAAILEENKRLLVSYDVVLKKMQHALQVLDEIEERDNNIYRAVFEEDIIPHSIREAGMGGVNRYSALENLGLDDARPLVDSYRLLDKLQKKAYIQSKSFDKIAHLAADKAKMQQSMPISAPVNLHVVQMSSPFGMRIHPKYGVPRWHEGIDLRGAVGTPIYATGPGVVTQARYASGYGNLVEINHGYGYSTRYGHLSRIIVSEGQRVMRGQPIGFMGATGVATGCHLHYEVRLRGITRNPLHYFENNLEKESEELLSGDDYMMPDGQEE